MYDRSQHTQATSIPFPSRSVLFEHMLVVAGQQLVQQAAERARESRDAAKKRKYLRVVDRCAPCTNPARPQNATKTPSVEGGPGPYYYYTAERSYVYVANAARLRGVNGV